jgi:hypothetical protein
MVFTYNNESQFKEIVNAYVRRGIDRNQINVLLMCTKEQQKFIESIDAVENVNSLFNSQDIMIKRNYRIRKCGRKVSISLLHGHEKCTRA